MKKWMLFLVLSSLPLTAWGASPELRALERVFTQRFESGYEERYCGANIMGLLDAARKNKVAVGEARMLRIENKGFSVFGMVNAEQARGHRGPEERNWYHHVVLEFECHVLDFDFGNEPRVLPLGEYVERMFLDEDPKPKFGFYVGRDRKLDDYAVTPHLASDYFAGSEKPLPTVTLRELVASCR